MFALGIRYLNGWAMATHPADRNRAEWPPHPDRVFMALAAAHFETHGDKDERHTLEWLQSLPPPALAVSDANSRSIVTSYVPVNDTEISRGKTDSTAALTKRLGRIDTLATLKAAKDSGLALLPEHRNRQARPFPVAVPTVKDDGYGCVSLMPRVYLIWNEDVPAKHQRFIPGLCAKVTSIGHSASLVQMWVDPDPPAADLVPLDGVPCKHRLRVTGNGRLEELQARYHAGLRPTSSLWQGYGDPPDIQHKPRLSHSCFDSNLLRLRRIAGPRVGLERTLQLTAALRDTVMSKCPQPPPAWVSGHAADGLPSQEPHLAFVPLPHVGHPHAEGHLLGAAIAVPRDISAEEQQRCLGAVLFDQRGMPLELEIRMGKAGVWKVAMAEGDDERKALQSETWTAVRQGAYRWATVTPILFDRHPKVPGDAESIIAFSCERIGLPRPKDVIVTSVSMFMGAPHACRYPSMPRKTGGTLRHAHAVLTFEQPVIGPVLLGAGRYRGYGLCRPLQAGDES